MLTKFTDRCDKCGEVWSIGTDIKPRFKLMGFNEYGKANYMRVPGKYVHVKCPNGKTNKKRKVDAKTGEIL